MKSIVVFVVVALAVNAKCKSLERLEGVEGLSGVLGVKKDLLLSDKEVQEGSRQARKKVASLNDALNCGLDVPCFLENLQAVLDDRKHLILAEADARYHSSSVARAESSESPSELAQTVEGIINKMTDTVKDMVSSWFKEVAVDATKDQNLTENEDEKEEEEQINEEQSVAEEGRGKKKKKLKSLVKLLVLGAVIKAKITLLLQLLSAALQVKFFFIALAGLIINKIRLWYDLKKGHNPQKVIYYEHAQHQHHYDNLEDEHHGGGGGFWGRAYEVPEEDQSQELAYRAQRPIPWQRK